MKILFLHNNFPAQYRWLAQAFAGDPKNQVVYGSTRAAFHYQNIENRLYTPRRKVSPKTHFYLRNAESAILNGQAAYRMAKQLKSEGFIPDIICSHAGWGPGHFMKEIYPQTPLLGYFEWFYNDTGSDFEFFPNVKHNEDSYCALRIKNTALLTDLNACDWGLAPTRWQWQQLPKEFRYHKVSQLHDGINTDYMRPDPNATFKVGERVFSKEDEVITYIGRGLEPYRGFPEFMEAVAILQKRRPNLHVLVVGEDRTAYGRELDNGKTYKQKLLEDHNYDLSRLHFLGPLPYNQLRSMLQVSSAHIYLSAPFVLSWSSLEAMATGCLIIGSATEPVQEIIEDEKNGLLFDFFDINQQVDKIEEALDNPKKMDEIRKNARQFIMENYSYRALIPLHMQLIEDITNGNTPKNGGSLIENDKRYTYTLDRGNSLDNINFEIPKFWLPMQAPKTTTTS